MSPNKHAATAAVLAFELEQASKANLEKANLERLIDLKNKEIVDLKTQIQASSSVTDHAAIDTASIAGTEDSDGGMPVNEIGLNNLVIDDVERAIPVQTETNGAYRGPAKSTQNGHNGRAFVEGPVDDPFKSSPSKHAESSPSNGALLYNGKPADSKFFVRSCSSNHGTPSSKHLPAHMMGNWRSGRSSSDDSPAHGAIDPKVSSQNAQAHYPPSACVFVANLLQTEDERELEYSVTRAFSKFGPVWVKIRRDPKGMPYAFCQYTCDEDATRAIVEGRGLLIHGRPCRTEKAKANRTFLMSRRYGNELTVEEARALLEKFGKVERAWKPSETDIFMFQLARGAFVTFVLYENGKEAMNAYKEHPEYHLQSINFQTSSPKLETSDESGKWLNSYDFARSTIFVGNLPPYATEYTVEKLFSDYGRIMNIEIVRKPSIREGLDLHVFAFVAFESPAAASRAIRCKHNYQLEGFLLKVAPKQPAHNHDDRAARNGHSRRRSSEYRSPEYMHTPSMPPPAYGYGYGYGHPATPMSYGGYPGYMPPPYPASYQYWPGTPGYSATPASAPHPPPAAGSYWSGYGVPAEYVAAQYQYSPTAYYSADYVQPPLSEERGGTPTPVGESAAQTTSESTL